MNIYKRLFACIIWILIGIGLLVCSFFDLVDSYWSGMGAALFIIGLLQLIRYIRYQKDSAYKEEVDTHTQDERNRFIAMKAWAWSGYLFVAISAVASIALKALGYDDYSVMAGLCVCAIVVLYWVSYWILRRKY